MFHIQQGVCRSFVPYTAHCMVQVSKRGEIARGLSVFFTSFSLILYIVIVCISCFLSTI